MNEKINEFKDILRMTQTELINWLVYEKMPKYDYEEYDLCQEYLYYTGNIPILLVAHLDTVHKKIPSDIYHDQLQGIMWSPQGIGGDDRCGVFSILEILETGLRPHILFTTDEETGAKGAKYATIDMPKNENINFMIELDRRGRNDCVFYECGNKKFADYIESFGFKTEWGTFSDISVLSPKWQVASVNLSVGYFDEHTTHETIRLPYMFSTIKKVIKILSSPPTERFDYEMIEYKKYGSWYNSNYYNYGNIDDDWDEEEYYKNWKTGAEKSSSTNYGNMISDENSQYMTEKDIVDEIRRRYNEDVIVL